VLYYSCRKNFYFYNEIELLQLFHGCLRLKFSSIWDSGNSDDPVKILCLNQDLDVPKGLDYLCVNALMIISSTPCHIKLNISVEMFKNLKSLSLYRTIFDDNAFSIISSLSFIEFILLRYCKIDSHLFEKCTTLQKIRLEYCEFLDPAFIKLPLSLKIFEIDSVDSCKVDASDCIKLNSL
jgi:hypothetical protein